VKNDNTITIFLVDDDALFLKSLELEFIQNANETEHNFIIHTFATGELCLENLALKPDVIILDYYLDGIDLSAMNGLETLDKIKEVDKDFSVIMLSSQDKIDVAVSCMHHKAFDYVVKSETAFLRLQKIIAAIFQFKKMEKELRWYMDRM
jgi:DNA-binding NarL/FixJ family response regulator